MPKNEPKMPVPGGFANADIPRGFENPRDRLPDAPLSRRGRLIYSSVLAAVIVGGVILIALAASN